MLTPRLQLLTSTVGRLLRRGATPSLKKVLSKYRPEELSVALMHLTAAERLRIFHLCPDDEYRASVLSELELDIAAEIVQELETKKAAGLLQKMNPDDAADILGELPEDDQSELLKLMRTAEQDSVEDLLRYDESTAGGIMNPHAFSLHRKTKVSEAIAALQTAERVEMAFYVYVVDDEDKLVGVVSLRQLVTSQPEEPLEDVMMPDVICVQPEEDQEEVARLASRYGFLAIPVVDDTRELLGIVTIDDVIDVIREEATEDILKMAGAGHALMESHSVFTSFRVRLPWLLATAIGGALAAAIIGQYEAAISEVIALAFFIPVVLGMGGNVGTQSASIVVRGLAMGRINPKQFWRVLGREVVVGLVLGVVYGAALGAFGFVRFAAGIGGWENAVLIGAVVGVSTLSTMTLGATVASVFPLVFERLHIDPAAASGPFVTTAVDILGTLTYFFVAKAILGL
jgi:magnesium transporter